MSNNVSEQLGVIIARLEAMDARLSRVEEMMAVIQQVQVDLAVINASAQNYSRVLADYKSEIDNNRDTVRTAHSRLDKLESKLFTARLAGMLFIGAFGGLVGWAFSQIIETNKVLAVVSERMAHYGVRNETNK